MWEKFRSYSPALEATCEITASCDFDLDRLRSTPLPCVPLQDFKRGQDADSYLWDMIFEKATQRYEPSKVRPVEERLGTGMEVMVVPSSGLI